MFNSCRFHPALLETTRRDEPLKARGEPQGQVTRPIPGWAVPFGGRSGAASPPRQIRRFVSTGCPRKLPLDRNPAGICQTAHEIQVRRRLVLSVQKWCE